MQSLISKHINIVNDDTSVVNMSEASLTDDTRAVIYDRHLFIVQATGSTIVCPTNYDSLRMT